MILNPFKCKECGEELQPENLLVGTTDGKLTRKCGFCGFEEVVEKDLKTLKDFFEYWSSGNDGKGKADGIDNAVAEDFIKGLKQEAIKDIKFFRKNRSSNPEYSKQELNGVEKYIMWKFNIIEEELK